MPDATHEPVVFAHTAESLFLKVLKDDVTPELSAKLRDVGLDLSRPLRPAYPVPVWNTLLGVTARALYPKEDLATACRHLGERMMSGYGDTLIGKAIIAMARAIGTRRAVLRTQKNWRSGNNYTEVECTELSPTDFRLVLNETSCSQWVSAGLLQAGLALTGAKELQVVIEASTETHATYRVTWQG